LYPSHCHAGHFPIAAHGFELPCRLQNKSVNLYNSSPRGEPRHHLIMIEKRGKLSFIVWINWRRWWQHIKWVNANNSSSLYAPD
jgi:hypothetical protein